MILINPGAVHTGEAADEHGFLAPIAGNAALFVPAAALLAAVSFAATSMWAIFGNAIQTRLHNPRLKGMVNILLTLSLVYTAIALTGLL